MSTEFDPTPRRCAIHPCRRTCSEDHATCDRHRAKESGLLEAYVQHREAELEKIEGQIAHRLALEELLSERTAAIAQRLKAERLARIAAKEAASKP